MSIIDHLRTHVVILSPKKVRKIREKQIENEKWEAARLNYEKDRAVIESKPEWQLADTFWRHGGLELGNLIKKLYKKTKKHSELRSRVLELKVVSSVTSGSVDDLAERIDSEGIAWMDQYSDYFAEAESIAEMLGNSKLMKKIQEVENDFNISMAQKLDDLIFIASHNHEDLKFIDLRSNKLEEK